MPSAAQIQELFSKVPQTHLATLREILLVLSAIVQNQELNCMNATNLSVCVTPCLVFKQSKEMPQDQATTDEFLAMNSLIAAMVPLIDNAAIFYTHLSRL